MPRATTSVVVLVLVVGIALESGLHATALGAGPPAPGKMVVPLFSIAKSENKNQVQYVVLVDGACAPAGSVPVSAYWNLLEKGPRETAPLLSREMPAYGLASQEVVERHGGGGQVRAVLRALPNRPLTITTSRAGDGSCRAQATTLIGGKPAQLFNVFVQLKWDGVDYLLVRGWSMDGSQIVRETVKR